MCVALFIIVFSIGFGPIPWMIMGEIFPTKMKNLASSVSAAFNWMIAFTVTKFFQTLIGNLGPAITFNFFGIICALGTVFVYTLCPETKGKSIKEVHEILLGIQNSRLETIREENNVCIPIKKDSELS